MMKKTALILHPKLFTGIVCIHLLILWVGLYQPFSPPTAKATITTPSVPIQMQWVAVQLPTPQATPFSTKAPAPSQSHPLIAPTSKITDAMAAPKPSAMPIAEPMAESTSVATASESQPMTSSIPAPSPAQTSSEIPTTSHTKVIRTPPQLNFNRCQKPLYTLAARRAETQGNVVITYTMEADGVISEATIEQSSGPTREHKQLDRATLEAVKACRGQPGTVDGKPQRLLGKVEYVWQLYD